MPLVKVGINALPSTACLSELAFLLASTAVMVIIPQVHALVVAACGVLETQQIANLVVLVAMISGSWVGLCQEATQPLGRKNYFVLIMGQWLHKRCFCCFLLANTFHCECDGQSHGYCYDEYDF